MADGLGIAMCFVEMLPTIPLHLAFHSSTPGLTRFAPEVYAAWPKSGTDLLDFSHVPPLHSSWIALHVLCEEIVKNVWGTPEKVKAVEPTWMMSMANVSTIGAKAAEISAGDGLSSSPHMPCSPVPHASHSPVPHASCSPVRHRLDLHLHSIIHKIPDLAHLLQAPVPGQGAHQAPAAQAHPNQALTMSLTPVLTLALMLDLRRLQKAVVPMGWSTLTPHHLM